MHNRPQTEECALHCRAQHAVVQLGSPDSYSMYMRWCAAGPLDLLDLDSTVVCPVLRRKDYKPRFRASAPKEQLDFGFVNFFHFDLRTSQLTLLLQ